MSNTQPAEGLLLAGSSVTITDAIEDRTPTQVWVNDQAAEILADDTSSS